jgi:hypothetical protein
MWSLHLSSNLKVTDNKLKKTIKKCIYFIYLMKLQRHISAFVADR